MMSLKMEIRYKNSIGNVVYEGYSFNEFFKKLKLVNPKLIVTKASDDLLIKHVLVKGTNSVTLEPYEAKYVVFYDPKSKVAIETKKEEPQFRFLVNETLIFRGTFEAFKMHLNKKYYVINVHVADLGETAMFINDRGEVQTLGTNPVVLMKHQISRTDNCISCMSFNVKPFAAGDFPTNID
jgi:hypothetical protein